MYEQNTLSTQFDNLSRFM